MPIETEAKMRLHHRAEIVQRLFALGAVHVADMLECNRYFDSPGGALASEGCALRVRELRIGETTTVILTHKGPRLGGMFKSREECELQVADAADARTLLEAMGYQGGMMFEKRRSRYTMAGCLVELDELPVLGHFIEIEGAGDDEVAAARCALGLEDEPIIEAGYAAMVGAYLEEHRGDDRSLRFTQM